jgi:hypothetical protein
MAYEVGQEVAIRSGYGYPSYRVATVTKITPKGQVVLSNGDRYQQSGRRIGGGSYRESIEPMTDELRATIRHRTLVERLAFTKWPTLPLSTLERVVTAMEQ